MVQPREEELQTASSLGVQSSYAIWRSGIQSCSQFCCEKEINLVRRTIPSGNYREVRGILSNEHVFFFSARMFFCLSTLTCSSTIHKTGICGKQVLGSPHTLEPPFLGQAGRNPVVLLLQDLTLKMDMKGDLKWCWTGCQMGSPVKGT